jgi:outer membrane protein assembly factor BamE (lipoprotein component of BamABCDE complex)
MKIRFIPKARWLVFGLGLAAIGALLLAGCLVIPVDYYKTGSRHNLNTKTPEKLQVGMTTKEEVFLLLGEPDVVYENGQNLRYHWRKVKAFWSVAVAPTGGGVAAAGTEGEIDRQYVLSVDFDSSNRVAQIQLLKHWESVRW